MGFSAREVALDCLVACERQGAWSDGYLRNAIRRAGLDNRDAGFCTRLAFSVQQNRMLLDWYLNHFSKAPVEKMEPAVRGTLRLGICQLLLMDRIPVHAAVNESVSLARKRSRNPRVGGLVNAVLRAVDRAKAEGLPQPDDLSIRYSHPKWLVDTFREAVGDSELEALLEADNAESPIQAQVNTNLITVEALADELTQAGVTARAHPWLPNCLELEDTGNLENLASFQTGKFYIQDAAARLAVLAADVKPGMQVLDACAAPGGKSFAAAIAMQNQGSMISCDIHPHKQKLIREGAARLGLTVIQTRVQDGKQFVPEWEKAFDLVMADVPCSGLGIIRKKPDIRYKDPGPLAGLPEVQKDILDNTARYVKPGGVLLYATCTVLERENGAVVSDFISRHSDFACETFTLPGPVGTVPGQITLWPHRHGTDGFFIAKLRRAK